MVESSKAANFNIGPPGMWGESEASPSRILMEMTLRQVAQDLDGDYMDFGGYMVKYI